MEGKGEIFLRLKETKAQASYILSDSLHLGNSGFPSMPQSMTGSQAAWSHQSSKCDQSQPVVYKGFPNSQMRGVLNGRGLRFQRLFNILLFENSTGLKLREYLILAKRGSNNLPLN